MLALGRTLVILPTYNEKENIAAIVGRLKKALPEICILVVDDNSPDGTALVVQKLAQDHPGIFFLLRKVKTGLGAAYLDAFDWAREQSFEAIVQMDADLSHRPEDLCKMLEQLSTVDVVIGSRYVSGGEIKNWSQSRRLLSFFGNQYAQTFLGPAVKDWTSGFVAWKGSALAQINLSKIASQGYSFQIELKYKAWQAGLRTMEIPIVFEDVREGQSKMTAKIAFEALYQVIFLRLKSLL